ncbi:MAG: methyltransferase domain-containing protein [Candidatus Latescibacterota bacterium]|nr:MAG: methyltransferase domain-containing protein [Candidatus Latescibacterota bacterium]
MPKPAKPKQTICPGCDSNAVTVFFQNRNAPAQINFLWETRRAALDCPRGDITLGLCNDCGLISNIAFDPETMEYREGYENSLHCSGVFQAYAEYLAEKLIERFDLYNKTIVEIGCGDGEFLSLLCERARNRGIGFDPTHTDEREGQVSDRIEFVRDLYSDRYADYEADFICSRHTLEHVPRPGDLLRAVRSSIGDRIDVGVFMEVPNARYTLENRFVWDVIYEHTSYFTELSLRNIFVREGFQVVNSYETFSRQYLCIEAYLAPIPGDDIAPSPQAQRPVTAGFRQMVDEFKAAYRQYIEEWQTRLRNLDRSGKKIVLWGAGSKGATFLNMFPLGAMIDRVVDINPRKDGMFVAGAGQKIIAPERLTEDPPDAVIVVNPVYKGEIAETCKNLGLEPELILL